MLYYSEHLFNQGVHGERSQAPLEQFEIFNRRSMFYA